MSLVILGTLAVDTSPFLDVQGGSERVFLAWVGLFRNASRRTCRARSIQVAANLSVLTGQSHYNSPLIYVDERLEGDFTIGLIEVHGAWATYYLVVIAGSL